MRLLLLHALVGLVGAAAVAAAEPHADPALPGARPVVQLVWFDATGALPVPAQAVAEEVARVFAAWGIDVRSKLGEAGVTVTQPPEINVIVQARRRAGRPEVLGEVEPGQNLSSAWVSVEAVERVLGQTHTPGRLLQGEAAHELTLALARVVAHEIAHLAAPDLPHASHGLMRATLGRADLTEPLPSLEGHEQHAFRSRLATFTAVVA